MHDPIYCSVCRCMKEQELFRKPSGGGFYKSCTLCRNRSNRWYKANTLRANEANREWRESHPEKVKSYFQAWKKKPGNKDRHSQWVSSWMRSHPREMRLYYKRWYVKNQLHLRVVSGIRQAVYRASSFTLESWLCLLDVFGYRCAYCLSGNRKLTMDHIQPFSKGGEHTEENIVPACVPCNSRKNDRLVFVMLSSSKIAAA